MKVRIPVLIIAVIMVVAFAVSCKEKSVVEAQVAVFDNINQRRQLIEDSIAAADEIASEVQMDVVFEIMKFLKESSYFIIPRSSNSGQLAFEKVGSSPDVPYVIGITALMQEDKALGEFWRKAYESEAYAFLFLPEGLDNSSLLFLKEYKASKKWKAVALIHEASHAFIHSSKLFKDVYNPELRNAYYELETYVLQGEILAAVGRKDYRNVLEQEIKRVQKSFEKKEHMSPNYKLNVDGLEKVFGRPESQKELEQRADSLWMDAVIKMFDRKFTKEEATELKILFMIDVHKQRNFFRN